MHTSSLPEPIAEYEEHFLSLFGKQSPANRTRRANPCPP